MSLSHLVNLNEETKVQLGELFIKWVTEDTPLPVGPAAMKVFTDKNISLNDQLQKVTFHQSTLQHMHIALPPKEYIQRALDHLDSTGEAYGLPKTYRRIIEDTTELSDRAQMHFRVGDYTLTHCY